MHQVWRVAGKQHTLHIVYNIPDEKRPAPAYQEDGGGGGGDEKTSFFYRRKWVEAIFYHPALALIYEAYNYSASTILHVHSALFVISIVLSTQLY